MIGHPPISPILPDTTLFGSRHAGEPRHQPVGDPRGNPPRPQVVLPLLPPSTDDVVALSELVQQLRDLLDRKSTRLNSSHLVISYAVFCLKKKANGPVPSASR